MDNSTNAPFASPVNCTVPLGRGLATATAIASAGAVGCNDCSCLRQLRSGRVLFPHPAPLLGAAKWVHPHKAERRGRMASKCQHPSPGTLCQRQHCWQRLDVGQLHVQSRRGSSPAAESYAVPSGQLG